MSVQLHDLLRSSFRCIDRLQPGFGQSTEEEADAIFILNAMLDSWSADGMNAYATVITPYNLVSGQATYTIGSGGNWNGPRPVKITKATLVVLTNPSSPLRLPLDIFNDEQWQRINLQGTASSLVQRIYYETSYPLGKVHTWPVTQEADQIELSTYQELAGNFTSGSQTFDAPPGYLDAVRYNLAVRLAMEFPALPEGVRLKPGVQKLADDAMAVVQNLNAVTPQMDVDPGVLPISPTRGSFNRLTGD